MAHGRPRATSAPTTATPAMDGAGWRRFLQLHAWIGDVRHEVMGRNNGQGTTLTAGGGGGGASTRFGQIPVNPRLGSGQIIAWDVEEARVRSSSGFRAATEAE
jgi:hypothetical protein